MKTLILAFLLPLTSFAAGKIVNADIAASGTANIARNKLAAGTAYAWCVNDVSGFEAGTAVTASRAVATDANGAPTASATTATELGYVNGVTSAIQTQLNGKQASGNYITALTGDVTASGPGSVAATVAKIQGTTVSGTTGSTNVVFSTAPTMSNPVVGTQASSDNSTKAASTAYVQTALAQLNPAAAVVAASTANIAGTYTNAVGGVCIGDTFQVTSTAAFAPDGVTLTVGQRFLMKDQSSSFQDGVWTLTTAANVGVLGALLTRALDDDSSVDFNAGQIIPVQSGTVNAGSSWYRSTSANVTCNSDAQTWTQFQKASSAYALLASANTFTTAGAASTPAESFTGTPFAGTATTSKAHTLWEWGSPTTNNWDTVGNVLGINQASGGTVNFLNFQVNSANVYKANYQGGLTLWNTNDNANYLGSLTLCNGTSNPASSPNCVSLYESGGGLLKVYSPNATQGASNMMTFNNATGEVGVGQSAAVMSAALGVQTLNFAAYNAYVTIIAKAKTSQTGDLQQWQNSSAAVLAKIDINGNASVQKLKAADAAGNTTYSKAGGTLVNDGAGNFVGSTISAPACFALTASGTVNVDWSQSNCFTLLMNANTTFTFSNRVAGQLVRLRITNPASYTWTMPNTNLQGQSVLWTGSVIPSASTGNKKDIVDIFYDGTEMYGSAAGNFGGF